LYFLEQTTDMFGANILTVGTDSFWDWD